MKKIILVLLIAVACVSEGEINYKPQKIVIQPNHQGGYDVYSYDGELLLEFTSTNTDSLSLETLKYTYEVSSEYYENPEDFEAPEVENRDVKISGFSWARQW